MWDLSILPRLNLHYLEDRRKLCAEFARQISSHAPGEFKMGWWQVDYPFFFTLDNDKRHARALQHMTWERGDVGTTDQPDYETHEQPPTVWNKLVHWLAMLFLLHGLPRWRGRLWGRWDGARETEGRVRAFFSALFQCTPVQCARWIWAQYFVQCRLLYPQQGQPLSAKTPEMNMPAEHMVRTIKCRIRKFMVSVQWNEKNNAELLLAKTYQKWLFELENGDLNASGIWQVKRSVAKMPCAAKILAAEKGESVFVNYTFRLKHALPEGQKEKLYEVKGTAGAPIRNGRWT